MTPEAIHQLLVEEAEKVGWPTHFKNDLEKHDLDYLREKTPRAFVWVLREYGTHLYDVSWIGKEHAPSCKRTPCWGECDGSITWLTSTAKTWPDARCYTWDSVTEKLVPSSYDEAVGYIRGYQAAKQERNENVCA